MKLRSEESGLAPTKAADASPASRLPEGFVSPFPSESAGGGAQADAGPRSSALISWMNSMSRLASLTRFSMERLSCRESVLEHLGQVALTSYALAMEVRARDPDADVSVRECVARALVHDLEELITGDVARPTKHSSPEAKRMFDDLARSSINVLRVEMSYFPSFAADMERCHWAAKHGVDGMIVAVADVLAVATKVWEEVILRGSGAMIRQAYSAERQLVALQSRIAREDLAEGAKTFLLHLLDEAVLLMWKAQRRDSDLFGTKVEAY